MTANALWLKELEVMRLRRPHKCRPVTMTANALWLKELEVIKLDKAA